MPVVTFLDLPFEVRRLILEFYFEGSHQTPFARCQRRGLRSYDKDDLDSRDTSSILKTCKTLYQEGMELYYRHVYFCRAERSPASQLKKLLKADSIRLNMRKFVGLPFFIDKSMGIDNWAVTLERFPALEEFTFSADRQLVPTMLSCFSPEMSQPELAAGHAELAAASLEAFFHEFNERHGLLEFLQTRPNLTVNAIVHFIGPEGHEVDHHAIYLMNVIKGTVTKKVSCHSFCEYADKYRSRSLISAQSRPCNPWDCTWITCRDNLIDLTIDNKAMNKICEERINTTAHMHSSSAFTFYEKSQADPLYNEKFLVGTPAVCADSSTLRTAGVLAFMEQYRLGEWDDWCPHGTETRGICGCPEVTPLENRYRTKK